MKKPVVAIIMGSDSDLPTIEKVKEELDGFGISYEIRVLSAHRCPEDTVKYAKSAKTRGIKVIVAGAGGAAHLAGVIAAHTILPVIGVPMATKAFDGIDSLLSTVQMPSGIPVGTMAIGNAGAINAGVFAAQILGIDNKNVSERLKRYKRKLVEKVRKKDKLVSGAS